MFYSVANFTVKVTEQIMFYNKKTLHDLFTKGQYGTSYTLMRVQNESNNVILHGIT